MKKACLSIVPVLLLVACSNSAPALDPERQGLVRATFLTDSVDPAVSAVRIDVSQDGAVVETRTLTPSEIVPPGGSKKVVGGDAYFVLAIGEYQVTATPLDKDGKRSAACTTASAPATVRKGQTVEIVLGILCGDSSGGLDVVVTVSHAPVVTGLSIRPGKFIGICDQVTLRLAAHGQPGEPLTYRWLLLDKPAGANATLFADGAEAIFKADTVGDYEVGAQAVDPAGHAAGLTFPIHAIPGPLCDGPGRAQLQNVVVEVETVFGAPYPEFDPDFDEDEVNQPDFEVPAGPFVAPKRTPTATLGAALDGADRPIRSSAPVSFTLNDPIGISGSTTAEPSGASGGGVIFVSSNWFAAYSTDGGLSFNKLSPTTIFPSDQVGFCCDQVVQYVPSVDRFIWLLQGNGMRVAWATPDEIINSGGTFWHYVQLPPELFGQPTGTGFDYPDVSVGTNAFYVSYNAGFKCPSGCSKGHQVLRIYLDDMVDQDGTITVGYTDPTKSPNTWGAHLIQNPRDEIFWAGHNNTSSLRVYTLKEFSSTYYWQDITIGSWVKKTLSSLTPDGVDWMTKLAGFPGNAVIGGTRSGDQAWFAWSAGTDNTFPQPHIEIVVLGTDKAEPPNLTLDDQHQVWNPEIAFGYPSLHTNACTKEIGMSFEDGGGGRYENHVVGFWGDFVAYRTTNSDTGLSRFGDYVTIRQAPSTKANPGNLFDAFGYGFSKTPGTSFAKADIRYVQFGRAADACQPIPVQ